MVEGDEEGNGREGAGQKREVHGGIDPQDLAELKKAVMAVEDAQAEQLVRSCISIASDMKLD